MNSRPFRSIAGLLAFTAAAATATVGTAQAQTARSVLARVHVAKIQLDGSDAFTAPASPGSRIEFGDATQIGVGLTYMLTDHVAVDFSLSAGSTFELTGAGAAAGSGRIGRARMAPITLLAQYRFLDPGALVHPYVGIGPTYLQFYREIAGAALGGGSGSAEPTFDSGFGLSVQAGVTYTFMPRWHVDLSVTKTSMKTRVTLGGGAAADARVDPLQWSLGLGLRF